MISVSLSLSHTSSSSFSELFFLLFFLSNNKRISLTNKHLLKLFLPAGPEHGVRQYLDNDLGAKKRKVSVLVYSPCKATMRVLFFQEKNLGAKKGRNRVVGADLHLTTTHLHMIFFI
jgi:hypothetical protein